MAATHRRLPVYLLLDCSGSMTGEPIEAVRQGVKALLGDLRGDPMALETAYLSVITFDSSAQQVAPLTELSTFQEPKLNSSGSTALGEALNLLVRCLDREVNKSSPTQKGDYKPLVFLMTDGQPTDTWEPAADLIKQKRPANMIACAAGPNADSALLTRFSEIVVELKDLQPKTMQAFFKWVSSSIKLRSQSLTDGRTSLPPTPPDIKIMSPPPP